MTTAQARLGVRNDVAARMHWQMCNWAAAYIGGLGLGVAQVELSEDHIGDPILAEAKRVEAGLCILKSETGRLRRFWEVLNARYKTFRNESDPDLQAAGSLRMAWTTYRDSKRSAFDWLDGYLRNQS